jgi:hypothetical protein
MHVVVNAIRVHIALTMSDDAIVGAVDSDHAYINAVDIVIVAIDDNCLRLSRGLIADVIVVAVDSEGIDLAVHGYVIIGAIYNE